MNERIKQSILRYRKHVRAVLASVPMQSPYWLDDGFNKEECNADAHIMSVFLIQQIRRGVVSPTGDNRP